MTYGFTLGRWLLAILFVTAGSLHFALTPLYVRIMPPWLPAPILLVQISGAAEIAGGLGLLYPPAQRAAAWGLIALLICVMPANVQMALDHAQWPRIPEWALWARIPFQVPLIAWAWLYARERM
jgi:uncharacterized membrane protein